MPFALPSQRKAAQAAATSPSQKTTLTAPPIPPHFKGVAAPSDVYDDDEHEITVGQLASDEPGNDYSKFKLIGPGLSSYSRLTTDGRIIINLSLGKELPDLPADYAPDVLEVDIEKPRISDVPALNILLMLVGSRGDIQPYLALALALIADGHRVRLGTHREFAAFVRESTKGKVEFFDIGGDPKELMSFMVKNPGLVPGFDSLTNGDIPKKRRMLSEIMEGCFNATHSPDPVTGTPFAIDALISNPPAFAHIHLAEALGLPLQLTFTMPWSATTAFAHPLVHIESSNAPNGLTNYLSFALAEMLQWQGLAGITNAFRTATLGLEPLTWQSGPSVVDRLKIPWTYVWSPSLIPKPKDWKNTTDIVGFYFLDLATGYEPPSDLSHFLAAGSPPIYIGFGSVPIPDPAAMSRTIFDAVQASGVRALVSAGWGGLGGAEVPEDVFILGNVPHDWLFKQVSAVCHHGGAGTTAIGLLHGRPTIICPFFGDQAFWGEMVEKAGAGPSPIHSKSLTAENLADAIRFATSEPAQRAAKRMSEEIQDEDGVKEGVESFYRHLPLKNMRCELDPSRVAVWWSDELCLRLSAFAAQTLVDASKIKLNSLEPHRPKEYATRKQATDPITGGATAILSTITHYWAGIGQIFLDPPNPKGLIDTTVAIPKGVLNIIGSIHEGFVNVPKLYGSEVRQPGKVSDLSSGVREGMKGLAWGYYDGIMGLVTEPLQGAKQEGVIGAIKGAGRSYINATLKPAAGIVGVVRPTPLSSHRPPISLPYPSLSESKRKIAHPATGARRSLQTLFSWSDTPSLTRAEQAIRAARVSQGRADVKQGTRKDREKVMRAFEYAERGKEARRREIVERAVERVQEPEVEEGRAKDTRRTLVDPTDTVAAEEGKREEGDVIRAEKGRVLTNEEARWLRQLAAAELRGYEKGKAESGIDLVKG